MTNKIKKTSLVIASIVAISTPALAQKKLVRSAGAALSYDGVEYVVEAKNYIDQAYVNPTTSNDPTMWLYRAVTYARCASPSVYGHAIFKGVDLNQSGLIAGQSMLNFLASPEKKSSDVDYANETIGSVFSAVYNESAAVQRRKNYDSMVIYMDMANKLYDQLDTASIRILSNSGINKKILEETYYQFVYLMSDKTKKINILETEYKAGNKNPLIIEPYYDLKLTEGDTAGAEKIVMSAFNENKTPEYFNLVQNYYIRIEKPEKLLTIVNDLISIDPSNSKYFYLRGKLMDDIQNDHKAALIDYKKAVELDEFNYDAYFDMAVNLINHQTNELRIKKVTARNPVDVKNAEESLKAVFTEAEKYLLIANENNEFSINDKININKALKAVYQELGDANKAVYYGNIAESLKASK